VFVGEGLNKRLNTEDLTMIELSNEAAKRGMTLADVWAMKEKDEWVYKRNKGQNMVCSSFVFRMYMEAGLFGNMDL
jgi:hypothetical protein